MSKFQERLIARKMRLKGYSINNIARVLNVSKGSVSGWCKEIKMTVEQKEILKTNMIKKGHKGRLLGAETNRRKKEEVIEKYKEMAKCEISKLSYRDILIIGVGLYWGEGNKSESGGFSFSNSDPKMVFFMFKWLKEIIGVSNQNITVRVMINQTHKNRINKVLSFWSDLLDLPVSSFYRTTFIKTESKKIYDNHDNYFGVLVIRVSKSYWLKYKILGQIEAVCANLEMPA